MVKSIVAWRTNETNLAMIEELKSLGITFYEENDQTDELNGLTYVITGSFDGLKRDEIKVFLENKGAKVASAVSKNTNYLVAGEKAGSKLTKAQELGIEIINEEKIKEMINEE